MRGKTFNDSSYLSRNLAKHCETLIWCNLNKRTFDCPSILAKAHFTHRIPAWNNKLRSSLGMLLADGLPLSVHLVQGHASFSGEPTSNDWLIGTEPFAPPYTILKDHPSFRAPHSASWGLHWDCFTGQLLLQPSPASFPTKVWI